MAFIPGTPGDDNPLLGTTADDEIYGYGGDDYILGLAGNDIIYGGDGNDIIVDGNLGDGGSENDDYIDAGAGDDLIINNGGTDTFIGGEGSDTLLTDVSTLEPLYTLLFDAIEGEHGRLEPSPFPNDTIDGIENFTAIGSWDTRVIGGAEENVFITDLGDDDITSNEGDDTIYSGGGSDTVNAGRGNDFVDAGDGADIIIDSGISEFENIGGGRQNSAGQSGPNTSAGLPPGLQNIDDDVYTGGLGEDMFIFQAAPGNDIITDFVAGEDQLDLIGIGISTFDALLATSSDTENGVLIDLGLIGSILLEGVALSDLSQDDLITL